MRVRLADIAEKVNLSKMAVSQIIQGTGSFRPETRERVLEMSRTLGYHVNQAARAMRKGSFDTIGLVIRDESFHIDMPATIIKGIAAELYKNGLKLILVQATNDVLNNKNSMVGISSSYMVDGLIVNCWGTIPDELREIADKTAFPASWINTDSPHNSVRPDDKGAGRIATEYLLHMGHRKIGYVDCSAGPAAGHFSSPERLSGYIDAMKAAGLPCRIFSRNLDREKRFEELSELFSNAGQATAFVTNGDFAAQPLILRAMSLGFKVPEDLSVICIGGTTSSLGISITNLPFPEIEIGSMSVKMLLGRISKKNCPLPSILIPFGEINGKSCAPPHPAKRMIKQILKMKKEEMTCLKRKLI